MSPQEIRLQCLIEVLRQQRIGGFDEAIEAARKAADFIISGGIPALPEDTQRKD